MMKQKAVHLLAVVLVGLGWAAAVSAVNAGNDTASKHAALRKACAEQGGRFEQSWMYNDQGVRWGEVLSCSTGKAYVTCQGDVCRGGRWAASEGVTVADSGAPEADGAMRFPAEPGALSAALVALSGN